MRSLQQIDQFMAGHSVSADCWMNAAVSIYSCKSIIHEMTTVADVAIIFVFKLKFEGDGSAAFAPENITETNNSQTDIKVNCEWQRAEYQMNIGIFQKVKTVWIVVIPLGSFIQPTNQNESMAILMVWWSKGLGESKIINEKLENLFQFFCSFHLICH